MNSIPQKGHIYTTYGAFFVQPVESYSDENPNVLHKITRWVTHRVPVATEELQANSTDSLEDELIDEEELSSHASHRTKRSFSVPQQTNGYTMKVLVGVDRKMQDYHRESSFDLKEYVLTLMSIVRLH